MEGNMACLNGSNRSQAFIVMRYFYIVDMRSSKRFHPNVANNAFNKTTSFLFVIGSRATFKLHAKKQMVMLDFWSSW